ncbi:hypothetical protein B0T20DRAFT_457643 [Sordaria brevicollis]|uniref:NACHT domain-containing protein n=1 Tax=Sordaria brevicollis TaxID=83679 RepID=A0AAE0U0I2_SORBR|nr:hypothetical protein B0T20DRAFT_457643 [Sordaria brevicollis]
MADPATILGVFSGSLQIISFVGEVITLSKKIVETGSPDPVLRDRSATLWRMSDDLQKSLSSLDPGSACTEEQLELQKTVKRCLSAARAVADELDKIDWTTDKVAAGSKRSSLSAALSRVRKKLGADAESLEDERAVSPALRSKRHSMVRVLKALVNSSKIQALEKDMKGAEQTLQTGLLRQLWLNSQSSVQDKREAEQRSRRDRILASLEFPDLNSRRNHVSESHERTLEWIFNNEKHGKWDNFAAWLESNESIYWIEGKPGAGKSTLMKLLVRDERTNTRLSTWTEHPIILSHFLWFSGTKDQRSLQKLLCSLLYQLLKGQVRLINQLMAQYSFLEARTHADEWSKAELRKVLFNALHILNGRVCIFLDGLDEVDHEDRVEFHRFIKESLHVEPGIKIYVASRPDVPLEKIVGRVCSKLRLQELTRDDISVTVRDFLSDFSLSDAGSQYTSKDVIRDEIIDMVIDRSEGVFLWVHLVLRRIHNGREAICSLDEVLKRIENLPRGLENLYKETWQRHGEDEENYRAEAAHYFRLTIEGQNLPDVEDLYSRHSNARGTRLSLLEITIASNERQRHDILYGKRTVILRTLLASIEHTRQQVQLCCGGLLEIRDKEPPNQFLLEEGDPHDWTRFLFTPLATFFSPGEDGDGQLPPSAGDLINLWEAAFCTQIVFIHKTAMDFVLDHPLGTTIMESCLWTKHQIRTQLVQSLISRILIYGTWSPYHMKENLDALEEACRRLSESGQSEISELVEELPTRTLERYRVINAILCHSTLDMRQSSDGGIWVLSSKGMPLCSDVVDSLIFRWFMMKRGVPMFDIIYHLIHRSTHFVVRKECTFGGRIFEDPGKFSILLLKIMYECTSGNTPLEQRLDDTGRFGIFHRGENRNSDNRTYDRAVLEEFVGQLVCGKLTTVDLDSRVCFVVRLYRHASFVWSVWGCPDYHGVNNDFDTDDVVIECNIAQLVRFARYVVQLPSVPGDSGGETAERVERPYDPTRARLEDHPVYRKVILITRRHWSKSVDELSVLPSDSQSEAICSLLEGKDGPLVWQELGCQLHTVFQNEKTLTPTDTHKLFSNGRAFPFNWSETGDTYKRTFKLDAAGSIIDEILGRLFLSPHPANHDEDCRIWFKDELKRRNPAQTVGIALLP